MSAAGDHPLSFNFQSQAVPCPSNGQIGKRVDTLTLKALLARSLTEVRDTEYRFCRASDCPTVYYSVDGAHVVAEPDLRERVYQKHRQDERVLVCYCFFHTIGSVYSELVLTGRSTVIEQISAGIQAGQCACDIRNPQGDCCLGNVRALVQQFEQELGGNPATAAE